MARFARAHNVSIKRAKKALAHELAYTLHKPVRRRFPTSPVLVFDKDEQWAADLIEVQSLSRQNGGTKYLLCVVDVLSKFAWVRPLKSKKGADVAFALESIMRGKRVPKRLQTDDGKEFYNSVVQRFLKSKGVHHFFTSGGAKASVVERFNRTFKERLYRFFTTFNTFYHLGALEELVKGYNNSYHRSIEMAPEQVNEYNVPDVWESLYGDYYASKTKKPTFKVGDKVRLNKKHRTFKKSYLPGWTEEVFWVTHVRPGPVTTYKIAEWDETPIKGTFYKEDLQKVVVTDDARELFRVDSVLKRRGTKVLVRWKGWPAKYDSWIPKRDLVPLGQHGRHGRR